MNISFIYISKMLNDYFINFLFSQSAPRNGQGGPRHPGILQSQNKFDGIQRRVCDLIKKLYHGIATVGDTR